MNREELDPFIAGLTIVVGSVLLLSTVALFAAIVLSF